MKWGVGDRIDTGKQGGLRGHKIVFLREVA